MPICNMPISNIYNPDLFIAKLAMVVLLVEIVKLTTTLTYGYDTTGTRYTKLDYSSRTEDSRRYTHT